MTMPLKIDFVSDIACPWCLIGLKSLDHALEWVAGDISAELHFQPFELNPQMAPEGQEITGHITEKYGITPAQAHANRENIRLRGEQLGFTFNKADQPGGGRSRIYNTFDATASARSWPAMWRQAAAGRTARHGCWRCRWECRCCRRSCSPAAPTASPTRLRQNAPLWSSSGNAAPCAWRWRRPSQRRPSPRCWRWRERIWPSCSAGAAGGAVHAVWLWRRLRRFTAGEMPERIDGAIMLALTFILWFCVPPLIILNHVSGP